MSQSKLHHSMFFDVLFPKIDESLVHEFFLRRIVRFKPQGQCQVLEMPLVVFDFETTGLDASYDRVIEIGAQKIVNGKVVGEFATLVDVGEALSEQIQKITGITDDMLRGQPRIEGVLKDFLKFIDGSLLVAHNAAFDVSFLKAECDRVGVGLEWPALCTLKLAREYLAHLESKSLDALARHYQLTFESRHRSIGDVKVTVGVLLGLLENEADHLKTFDECMAFLV